MDQNPAIPDDEVAITVEDLASSEDFFSHRDDQNTLLSVTDALGEVVQRFQYWDYGTPRVLDESGGSVPDDPLSPHLYTSRPMIAGSGLLDYRFRVMDPRLGRFMQKDPIQYINTLNFYVYIGANPYRYIDPLGLVYVAPVSGFQGPGGPKNNDHNFYRPDADGRGNGLISRPGIYRDRWTGPCPPPLLHSLPPSPKTPYSPYISLSYGAFGGDFIFADANISITTNTSGDVSIGISSALYQGIGLGENVGPVLKVGIAPKNNGGLFSTSKMYDWKATACANLGPEGSVHAKAYMNSTGKFGLGVGGTLSKGGPGYIAMPPALVTPNYSQGSLSLGEWW